MDSISQGKHVKSPETEEAPWRTRQEGNVLVNASATGRMFPHMHSTILNPVIFTARVILYVRGQQR